MNYFPALHSQNLHIIMIVTQSNTLLMYERSVSRLTNNVLLGGLGLGLENKERSKKIKGTTDGNPGHQLW